jgi:hypothetical protein
MRTASSGVNWGLGWKTISIEAPGKSYGVLYPDCVLRIA